MREGGSPTRPRLEKTLRFASPPSEAVETDSQVQLCRKRSKGTGPRVPTDADPWPGPSLSAHRLMFNLPTNVSSIHSQEYHCGARGTWGPLNLIMPNASCEATPAILLASFTVC